MYRATSVFLTTAVLLVGAATLSADTSVDVTVDGQMAPWHWVNGGLNTAFQFSIQDDIGILVVNQGNSGIDFSTGNLITITYLSGTTNAFGVGSGVPDADASGHANIVENDGGGSTGTSFPSLYMGPYPPDILLNELVGTFTDSSGAIFGNPFAVGLGGTFAVPAGASQLQLGLNDDLFSDNVGALKVSVSGPTAATNGEVPEPGSVALLGTALAGMFVAQRRKRTA